MFLFKFALKGTWGNDGKWSFLLTLNGVLTGMVAQCAGCDEYAPWGALIVGMFGGAAFILIHTAMLKCRLDDPLDAVAVHGGGGKICLGYKNQSYIYTSSLLYTYFCFLRHYRCTSCSIFFNCGWRRGW